MHAALVAGIIAAALAAEPRAAATPRGTPVRAATVSTEIIRDQTLEPIAVATPSYSAEPGWSPHGCARGSRGRSRCDRCGAGPGGCGAGNCGVHGYETHLCGKSACGGYGHDGCSTCSPKGLRWPRCCCCCCSTCDMIPWRGSIADTPGYYYFRPYNYRTALMQRDVAAQWGIDRRNPYSNEFFQAIYEELEARDPDEYEPVGPGSPYQHESPGDANPEGYVPDDDMPADEYYDPRQADEDAGVFVPEAPEEMDEELP